jgi:hypothetical protein
MPLDAPVTTKTASGSIFLAMESCFAIAVSKVVISTSENTAAPVKEGGLGGIKDLAGESELELAEEDKYRVLLWYRL